MAEDKPKVTQARANDTRTDHTDLFQMTNKVTFLPGTLQSRSDFYVNDVTGMLNVNLLLTMPDNSQRTITGITVLGHMEDIHVPEAGSIYKVTWPTATFQTMSSILESNNRQLLQAQFWMTPNDFKKSLTPKGKAALEPQSDAIKPPPFNKLMTTLFNGDKCKWQAPKTMQQAMTQMGINDGTTRVYGAKQPGQAYDSHAMVVNTQGIFMYDSDKGEITSHTANGKHTMTNLHLDNDTEHKNMQMIGLPSTNGPELLPQGNIFMPHPKRLPSLEIVELVINTVDVAKLIIDFIDAYKKMDTGT